MKPTESKTVVIATDDVAKGIYIIIKDAMVFDKLDIQFTDKFAPTVEYLLRALRKGCGWIEQDRGQRTVKNTRCIHSANGVCMCESKLVNGQPTIHCVETVRASCKDYKIKFIMPITVNYVTIEKVGQIRNL